MSDLRTRFGNLVQAHRLRQGLSQQQLAEAADLSPAMIGRIENGATGARFPSIERIAAALGIDPAELFHPGLAIDKPAGGPLLNLAAKLSKLTDRDLLWAERVLDTILSRP